MAEKERKPSIRFKGFTDDWEQCKLGDVLETVTDYVAAGSFADLAENVIYRDSPDYAQLVRTMDIKNGFTSSKSVFVDERAFSFLYRVNLDKECIILPNIGNCGEVYLLKPEKLPYRRNVLGPNAILIRSEKSSNEFLSILMQGADFQNKLALIISPNGQTKFNKTELKQIEVILPKREREQELLGKLFANLDNLITLHQRKYDALVNVKKSMLEKMFPKNGSSIPEIRFKGFTDAWEQRKVSDVSEICAGGTPSTAIERYWFPKEIPWLSSGEVHKKRITFTDNEISKEGMDNSSARIVPENSVLIALAGQGKTRGTVAINRIPLTTNQSIAAMTFTKEIVPEFVFCNLENRYDEIRKMSSGDGSRGGLNKQIVGDIEIPYTSKEEQMAIGNYFERLDNLITLHQRELEKLQNFKKACLQKMFV